MLLRTAFLLWALTHAGFAFAQAREAPSLKPDLVVIGSIVSDETEELPSSLPSDVKDEQAVQRRIFVRKIVIRAHRVVEGSLKSDFIEAKSVRTIFSTSKIGPDPELRALLRELGLPHRTLPDRSGNPTTPLFKAWRFELARINNDPSCLADSPALLPRLEPRQVLGPEPMPCYRVLRDGIQSVKGVFVAPEKKTAEARPAATAQSKDQRVAVL